ncbi:AraC family transcriptional regulator [Pectobacterium wasabiae]|uniref:AraC family transcriptional regulator n=2 Tax=Pectobacterium wasabiae TaxID=55208 RepID=A0AAW3EGU0_9GAMM|nr:AraC family transcriptional regulator [Pectobacterium wasabiae CFBP 3304]EJS94931.1 PdtC, QsbA [Pectobacterium wasabiae CFBP 3304]KFX04897.1 AraC family transcriptional regulator [Pectobacterium wasabiae]KGA27783.1 AraC family transcriptional regulator [Pectobacterium wasabiae]
MQRQRQRRSEKPAGDRCCASEVDISGARRTLPGDIGECWSDFSRIDAGLSLARSQYRPRRAWVEETHNPHSQPMLVMTFALAGESAYCDSSGSQVWFREQHVTITTFGSCVGERRYQAQPHVDQLRLLVEKTAAARYFGSACAAQLFSDDDVRLHAFTSVSSASQIHVNALCSDADPLNRHIHALSLLSQYRYILQPKDRRDAIHPQEREQLEQVCCWMREHLPEPLTLACIAAQAGMSESRLKLGFHRCFATTPGQMLLRMRMERAHQLLELGFQVAQTAWQVGYRHPANFSLAFTRYFNRNPKMIAARK